MKQIALFGGEKPLTESRYSSKIETPIYEPKNAQPHIGELFNSEKSKRLIQEINKSEVSEQEKAFLVEAAKRHTVFNYEKVADYYAHATPEVQSLMEKSALVIVDFEKAIEYGYVRLCDEIKSQYMEEYGE